MASTRKIWVLIGLCVALFALVLWLSPGRAGRAKWDALGDRVAATRLMAEYLARQLPGSCAVVLSNPFVRERRTSSEIRKFEDAGVDGLRKGFGKAITIKAIVFPELKEAYLKDPQSVVIDPLTRTPLSYVMREDAFDQAAAAHSDCPLLVSLIGLPADLKQTKFWMKPGAPRLALLLPDLRMVGNAEAVRRAVTSGQLVAAVLEKPGAAGAGRHEDRFLLLNADTVDGLIAAYPALF